MICNSTRDLWNKADCNLIYVNASVRYLDDRCSKNILTILLISVTHTAASSGVRRTSVYISSLYERFYDKRTGKVAQECGGRRESQSTHTPDVMNEDFRGSVRTLWINGITVPYIDYCRVLPDPLKLCVIKGLNFRRSIFWDGEGVVRPSTCSNLQRTSK
jgi:hypothetical protein